MTIVLVRRIVTGKMTFLSFHPARQKRYNNITRTLCTETIDYFPEMTVSEIIGFKGIIGIGRSHPSELVEEPGSPFLNILDLQPRVFDKRSVQKHLTLRKTLYPVALSVNCIKITPEKLKGLVLHEISRRYPVVSHHLREFSHTMSRGEIHQDVPFTQIVVQIIQKSLNVFIKPEYGISRLNRGRAEPVTDIVGR